METELHSQLLEIVQKLDPSMREPVELDRMRLLQAGITTFSQLLNAVKSPGLDDTLRIIGIWFLAKLPISESVTEVFTSLLSDQSAAIRHATIESIGKLGNRTLVPLLIHSLQEDPSIEVRKMAAYSLGLIGDSRAIRPLCAIAVETQEPEQLRGMIAEALGNLADIDAAPTLCRLISDPSLEVQYWSIYALGEIPLSGVELARIRHLLEQLTDSATGRVREQAMETLSRLQER